MEYTKEDIQKLEDIATQVRRDVVRMVFNAGSGHPGGALGCTDYFVALHFHAMKLKEEFDMDGLEEDLFFLSNGHISAVYYSTLARRGYFPIEELSTHRKIDSRLQGHPATEEGLPGIRVATGSLGQGLSVAVGAAQAKKLNNDDSLVYVLMGDGEQQEGQIWEAAMYAAHYKMDNMIAAIDYNNAQIDGMVDETMGIHDLKAKWSAFGWETIDCPDGNDMEQVLQSIDKAQSLCGKGKPVVILLNTIMGKGVDYMMDKNKWHGNAPNEEQFKSAMDQLQETLGDF